MIIKIVKEKKDGSFIIFSEYDSSFYPITHILKENNITRKRCNNRIICKDINKINEIRIQFS